MPRSSARASIIAGGVFAAEVAVTALTVCRDQAAGAVGSLLAIGAGAFAIVALAIVGHRFIGRRTSPPPEGSEPWAWRRPWFAAVLASLIAMALIVGLGAEVAVTQPGRCS